MKKLKRSTRQSIINHVGLIILSLVMIFPISWWLFATFKPMGELSSTNLLPVHWTLDNYINGWHVSKQFTMGHYFLNTITIVVINVIGCMISSSLIAFGFARLHFKGRDFLFSIVMMTLMLPSQVTVVSQYIMFNKLNLIDTYVPICIGYVLGGGAFFIFMMVQFVRGIPHELDESAKIDGANSFQIYSRIILPLMKAPLTTVCIYAFTWSWDDFYSQLLYISSPSKFTVGLGLRMFVDAWEIQWGNLLAMALLSIIPALLLFFFNQKNFVEGVATSGLKG